jgi:hypothetical protein
VRRGANSDGPALGLRDLVQAVDVLAGRQAEYATELRCALVADREPDARHPVIDALDTVADETGASPAAVALSWVQNPPAVTSTLIGARRVDQLRANLDAIDVRLTRLQTERLNVVSEPKLNFPAENNRLQAPSLAFAGATVDGVATSMRPGLRAAR